MIKYCPYCGKESVQKIGISCIGSIFKCLLCRVHFIVADPQEI